MYRYIHNIYPHTHNLIHPFYNCYRVFYYIDIPSLFNLPSIDGYYDCFQSSAITNDTYATLCTCTTYQYDKFLKGESNF